ncbi:MAG TPA: flagellar hook-associated protein FlgK [Planctomycetaceae bacterium]|jgi:flagellar hook-associated protein 1 FlgK|nr:flagellar hook-associated protein FlgK [Planctomycetaceae bacterium]
MGLGAALNIASNALNVFSTGVQITGQNLTNASTPGYIVEDLNLQTAPSYGVSPLILGSGVEATGVTQQVNQFLQKQILGANSDYSASNELNSVYTGLQQQLQALGDNNLSTQFSNFSNALSSLANQPSSAALNSQAVDAGTRLATAISTLRESLDTQRQTANSNVQQLVTQANTLIQNIVQLNPQITKLESSQLSQSQAGSLRDQRYQDLNQLSQILPITYNENSDGSVNIYSGSNYLVLGQQSQQLQTVNSGSQGVSTLNVQFGTTGGTITASTPGSGQLAGVLQGRDNVLGGFVQNLDTLTSAMVSSFNQVYASGAGTDGYTSVTSADAVSDPTAALNQAGLASAPQNGTFQLQVVNQTTGLTTTSTINVNLTGSASDTTLNSLAAQLNGVANVLASVTPDGHLQIDANSGFEVKFGSDTSNVLSSLGVNTFFTGHNSADIGVNSAVTDNPNLFASGQGTGPTDGSNALALSQFASNPLTSLNGESLNDNYNALITDIGNKASAETTLSQSQNDFVQSLNSQQQQVSGVSLDQQAIKLMQYQENYQASAKIVTTIDQLYSVLMQM